MYRTSGHVPYYEDSQFPQLLSTRENARPLLKYLRQCRDAYELPDAGKERSLVRQAGILDAEYPWDEPDPVKRFAALGAFCASNGFTVEATMCSQSLARVQGIISNTVAR